MASPIPQPQPRIVDGRSDDVDRVMVVMDSAFAAGFGEGWTRSQLAGILPMAGVSLWVADDGERSRALGFALARRAADESELLLLAVAPDVVRRGIARRLLDQFIGGARSDGVRRVHLEVRDGNPAVLLYRQAGFVPIGRRPHYYRASDGSRHDAVTMARDLA